MSHDSLDKAAPILARRFAVWLNLSRAASLLRVFYVVSFWIMRGGAMTSLAFGISANAALFRIHVVVSAHLVSPAVEKSYLLQGRS